jgi:uncharacterized membrane protein YgcG
VTRRRTTTAPPELRQARVKNAILREQITERRLQRQAKVLESAPWVEPYAELIGRLAMRDLQFRGPATRNDRRYGVDYPMARTEQELSLLRAPSRVLLATNSYAIGLANGITNYVVGPKTDIRATCDDPGVQSACQDVLDEFVKLNDYHGGLKPSVERENFWRGLEDGEWINLLFPQADGTTHIRMVDPEQVTQPPGTDFREWGFGKCADPDDPEAVEAFWITFGGTANEGKEYDVSRVVWNKRNTKRSMKFGLPDYCDSTHDLLMLAGKIAMNLGTATEMQASVAGVRQHTGATVDQVQGFVDENTDHQRLDVITNQLVNVDRRQPGRMEDIGENTEYVSGPSAEWGMVHLEILAGVLMGASRRWCAPRWLATGDASDSNYSNALSEGSPFVKQVLAEQAAVTASNVRAAEYALEHWCRTNGLEVKSEGGLVARTLSWPEVKRLVKVECTATSPIATERLAETQRRAILLQAGVMSVATCQQEEGLDPETEQANTDEYRERNPMMGDPLAPFGQPGQDDEGQGGGGGGPKPQPPPAAGPVAESKDDSGHEHKGSGPGGGQFTSGGGGAGGAGAKGGKNKKAPDDVKGSAMTPAWSDVPKEVADRLVAQQAEAANQIRARQGKPAVEYDLKFLPLGDVKPSQTGEDYDNASSRDLATRITKYDPDERPADYAPIAVDEAGVIVDGNHRHAAHTFAGLDSIPVLVPKGGDAAKPLAGKLTSHLAGVEHAAQTGDVATVRAHLADVLKGRSKAELAEAATAMGYNVKGDSGKKIVELLSQHYERMAVSAMRSKVIRGEI